MLSRTLIVIHTFDSRAVSRVCVSCSLELCPVLGSSFLVLCRKQRQLRAHLFLSVFRVIFPLRSFHFSFLLRCLPCAFGACFNIVDF